LTDPPKYITIAVDRAALEDPMARTSRPGVLDMDLTSSHDLALSLDWEYDWDFIRVVEEEARALGLKTVTVSPANIAECLEELRSGRLGFRVLLDRAAASSPDFLAFQTVALERGLDVIEPADKLRWASDKATMHLEFITHGIHTPYTLILPSYESAKVPPLRPDELLPLGLPFVIKPANTTGGSLGVLEASSSLEEVLTARQAYPLDKYLLQEKIIPEDRDGRRFWFRGFYILGEVHSTWWDDRTHVYDELAEGEAERYSLRPLDEIVRTIARISGLRFFSTEIVRDVRGRFVAVDYVNEICDMRLRSRHPDGVPDAVVRKIASRIASYVREGLWARPGGIAGG
jgi:glutathione synthase/RimK-type ligase-like ATP-grasp enzyme